MDAIGRQINLRYRFIRKRLIHHPWRRVTVFFHPDLIRQAAYGRITFLAQQQKLVPLDNDNVFYEEFDVPDRSATNPPLGVYMHRSDSTGLATISISVQFAAGLGMALPRPLDARVNIWGRGLRGVVMVDLDSDLHSSENEFVEYSHMSASDLDSDEEEFPAGCSGKLNRNVRTISASQPPDFVVKGHAYKTKLCLAAWITRRLGFRVANPRMLPEVPVQAGGRVWAQEDLKKLALASLRSQLSPKNVVQEALTSVYPEIQDIEVKFLIEHLSSLTGEIDEILRKIYGPKEGAEKPRISAPSIGRFTFALPPLG
ncbi:hypothetical protein C8R44DRAFT_727216 [Mycena epipterygia]|nr:hypothetical protein C8R44DRAFT_727216 [Mycena epipterygia]